MQKTDVLPGYTGYRPQFKDENLHVEPNSVGSQGKASQIPGYQGYITGIKSENVFSLTYGRSTGASAEGGISRGFDLTDQERYQSVSQLAYTPQRPLQKNILKDFPFTEEVVTPKRQKP